VDHVPDPLLLRKSGSAGNRTRTSGSVTNNSDHWTTDEAEWTQLQTHHLSENLVATGIEPGTSASVAKNSDHQTTEAVNTKRTIYKGLIVSAAGKCPRLLVNIFNADSTIRKYVTG
jgi:hypothetical protein